MGGLTREVHPVGPHPIIGLGLSGPILWGAAEGGPFITALSLLIFKAFILGEHHCNILHIRKLRFREGK